jgi:hypothetical protein
VHQCEFLHYKDQYCQLKFCPTDVSSLGPQYLRLAIQSATGQAFVCVEESLRKLMNLKSSLSRRLRLALLFGLFLTAAFTVSTSGTGSERWTNSVPSNPPPARFNPTLVSDSVNDRAIVFGGGANCDPLNDV